MSKISINISYKNACILKHALRDKIKEKKAILLLDNLVTIGNITKELRLKMEKELEEEEKTLKVITEEIKRCGFIHNEQIFG